MTKLTAAQVVDKLLEYAGTTPPPAGSRDDPWRQGKLKQFKFTAKDFLGHRAYPHPAVPTDKTEEEPVPAPETGKLPVQRLSKGLGQRMKWKPPEEPAQ